MSSNRIWASFYCSISITQHYRWERKREKVRVKVVWLVEHFDWLLVRCHIIDENTAFSRSESLVRWLARAVVNCESSHSITPTTWQACAHWVRNPDEISEWYTASSCSPHFVKPLQTTHVLHSLYLHATQRYFFSKQPHIGITSRPATGILKLTTDLKYSTHSKETLIYQASVNISNL